MNLPADAMHAKRASQPLLTHIPNATHGDAAAKDLQITLEKLSTGAAQVMERAMNMLLKKMSGLITCLISIGAHGPSNGTCRIRARPLITLEMKLRRKISQAVLKVGFGTHKLQSMSIVLSTLVPAVMTVIRLHITTAARRMQRVLGTSALMSAMKVAVVKKTAAPLAATEEIATKTTPLFAIVMAEIAPKSIVTYVRATGPEAATKRAAKTNRVPLETVLGIVKEWIVVVTHVLTEFVRKRTIQFAVQEENVLLEVVRRCLSAPSVKATAHRVKMEEVVQPMLIHSHVHVHQNTLGLYAKLQHAAEYCVAFANIALEILTKQKSVNPTTHFKVNLAQKTILSVSPKLVTPVHAKATASAQRAVRLAHPATPITNHRNVDTV
jgi:hypothetical protein